MDEPLRLPDVRSHVRRPGLSESHTAMPVSQRLTCLVARFCHREERVWTVSQAEKEAGRALTEIDEETLVMLTAKAAATQDRGRGVGGESGID